MSDTLALLNTIFKCEELDEIDSWHWKYKTPVDGKTYYMRRDKPCSWARFYVYRIEDGDEVIIGSCINHKIEVIN